MKNIEERNKNMTSRRLPNWKNITINSEFKYRKEKFVQCWFKFLRLSKCQSNSQPSNFTNVLGVELRIEGRYRWEIHMMFVACLLSGYKWCIYKCVYIILITLIYLCWHQFHRHFSNDTDCDVRFYVCVAIAQCEQTDTTHCYLKSLHFDIDINSYALREIDVHTFNRRTSVQKADIGARANC